jgi:hypothetical protein
LQSFYPAARGCEIAFTQEEIEVTDTYEIVETDIGFEVLKNGKPYEYGRAWTTCEQAEHQIAGLKDKA